MRLIPYIWDNMLPVLAGLLLAYMIGSFIGVSFNPALWTENLRTFMVIFGLWAGVTIWIRLRLGGAYE